MDQSHRGRGERDVPLSQTNRQLWPALKFIPAGQRPVPDPGVIPVRCVELLCRAASEPRGDSPRSAEPASQPPGVGAEGSKYRSSAVIADHVSLPESTPHSDLPSLPELPEMEMPALPQTPKRPGRGRPRVLTPLKREVILKALSQGKSRNDAAKSAKVCPATIRLEIKRDVTFALDVQVAEEEGREFRQVFERLFVPGRVRLETEPVISTPEFEREKEFLVSRRLLRDWVSRMRLVRRDEIEALVEYDEIRYRMAAKKGFRDDIEKALNFLAGEEIVETELSPDGRQIERVKIHRRPPPSETALADRVASLERVLDLPALDVEMLIAEMESRPWQCSRCRKKQKPPGGTGGKERGTTTSTVQSEATFDVAGGGSVPPASSIRRRRVRRAGLAEVHSFVNVSKTSGDS